MISHELKHRLFTGRKVIVDHFGYIRPRQASNKWKQWLYTFYTFGLFNSWQLSCHTHNTLPNSSSLLSLTSSNQWLLTQILKKNKKGPQIDLLFHVNSALKKKKKHFRTSFGTSNHLCYSSWLVVNSINPLLTALALLHWKLWSPAAAPFWLAAGPVGSARCLSAPPGDGQQRKGIAHNCKPFLLNLDLCIICK